MTLSETAHHYLLLTPRKKCGVKVILGVTFSNFMTGYTHISQAFLLRNIQRIHEALGRIF